MNSMGTAEIQQHEQATCISSKGTGMFVPRIGRDPKDRGQQLLQQQQRLKNKKLSASRAGKSRTTAIYMPFLRPGGVLYPCSSFQQPGRLQSPAMMQGGPVTGTMGQLAQQQCMLQVSSAHLGPRSSNSGHSSSHSDSSSVLEHPTLIQAAGPPQLSCAGSHGTSGGHPTSNLQNKEPNTQQQCLPSNASTAGAIDSNAGAVCISQQPTHVLHTHVQQPAQHWVHPQPNGMLEPSFGQAASNTIVSNAPCAEPHNDLQHLNSQQGVSPGVAQNVTQGQAPASQPGEFLLVSGGSRASFNKWGPIGPQQQQQGQASTSGQALIEVQGGPPPSTQVRCSNSSSTSGSSSSVSTANGSSASPGQLIYTMSQPAQLISYSQGPNQLLQVSPTCVSPVYCLQLADQQQQQHLQLQLTHLQPTQQQQPVLQQQAGLHRQAQGLPPASTPAHDPVSNALMGPAAPQAELSP